MAKIVISHGIPVAGLELLNGHEVIIPPDGKAFSKEEIDDLIVDADAFLACGKLNGDTIQKAKRLKIISNYGAGYDQVDIETASACGIPVANIPDSVTRSTAQLALGLIFAINRKIGEMTLRARLEQPETLFGMGKNMGHNLYGRTLGIVGLGRIGQKTAELASMIGMNVLGYSRHPKNCPFAADVTFETLLKESDMITLCCPLTDETRNLISYDQIAMMKRGAAIINVARGPVLDLEALCDGLESGHLSAAALDVFPKEPQIPEQIVKMNQIILTPHIGTNTYEARQEMLEACCRQILIVLKGGIPDHIVNQPFNK